jgi:hypothetical protein
MTRDQQRSGKHRLVSINDDMDQPLFPLVKNLPRREKILDEELGVSWPGFGPKKEDDACPYCPRPGSRP